MQLIDSLAYVSLPRFAGADDYVRAMDAAGVESAIVTTTPECLDLGELSRAVVLHGDRLRAVGLPTGNTPAERRESVAAQLDAGFAGMRLSDEEIAAQPELLEALGAAGRVAYVTGAEGLRGVAETLCEHLDHHPGCLVCATDFGGVADPRLFDTDLRVRWLFRHPRFAILCTGADAWDAAQLRAWLQGLLPHTGWERVLWASQYPLSAWRSEAYGPGAAWPPAFGLAPSETQQQAFASGNARRLLFARPAPPARPLDPKWCRAPLPAGAPVRVALGGSVDLPEEANRKLFAAYHAWGGEARGQYSDFLRELLIGAIDQLGHRPLLPSALPRAPAAARRRRTGTPAAAARD